MRPQDIEKIARSVVGGFTQAGEETIKAGCGAFSNPEAFSCADYWCSTGNYECGEMGNFTCTTANFSCPDGFFCAADYTG